MESFQLLIATIGNRDPESGAGPLGALRAATELRPKRVGLLALPDVKENAQKTADRIRSHLAGCDVAVLDISAADPADLGGLMGAVDRAISGHLDDGQDSVAVCATSGTPQLSLATTLVLMARCPSAVHYQALDPAKASPPHLRRFDPDSIRHHTETEQAFLALEACRFGAAESLLTRRLEHLKGDRSAPGARRALDTALLLARALLAAESMDMQGAHRCLATGIKQGSPLEPLAQHYRSLAANRRGNPLWPAEIGAVALRQQRSGLQAPALLTTATAAEVALAVRLRTEHEIDPPRVDESRASDWPEEIRPRLRNEDGHVLLQGAENLSEVLRFEDPGYNEFLKDHDAQRKRLLEARNKLIHEGKAPDPETVESSLAFLDGLFGAFGWAGPSDCVSAPEAIRTIVDDLRRQAGFGAAVR